MSKGHMFIDMKWELEVKMHPNNYAYMQRVLAELCVDLANQDVLDGWAIKCPNLAREKQDGLVVQSVPVRVIDELLAAQGSG